MLHLVGVLAAGVGRLSAGDLVQLRLDLGDSRQLCLEFPDDLHHLLLQREDGLCVVEAGWPAWSRGPGRPSRTSSALCASGAVGAGFSARAPGGTGSLFLCTAFCHNQAQLQ